MANSEKREPHINRLIILLLAFLLLGFTAPVHSITDICPAVGIQTRAPGFQPGGIILTSFDKANLWVYNVDRDSRYPCRIPVPVTATVAFRRMPAGSPI